MAAYLLDTNHLGAALDRNSKLRDRIRRARGAGHKFGTCIPAICELEAGIEQTPDPDANRRSLDHLLQEVRIWPLDRAAAVEFGKLFVELRRAGIALSQVDLMLSALARINGAILLSTDRDFERVAGVRLENWLAPATNP